MKRLFYDQNEIKHRYLNWSCDCNDTLLILRYSKQAIDEGLNAGSLLLKRINIDPSMDK